MHLRLPRPAVAEHDRDVADAEPGADGPVGHLDLEAVAVEVDPIQVERLQDLAAKALEAAGEVADVDAEKQPRVETPALGQRAAMPPPALHAPSLGVARAENEVRVPGRFHEARDVGGVVREVGVHLEHEVRSAVERVRETRQVSAAESLLPRAVQDAHLRPLGGEAVGDIPGAQKLKDKYPPGLVEITRLPGFGPKRARKLFDELGIASLDDLRQAAEQEKLRELPGFGPKAEENVLVALDAGLDDRTKPRLLLSRALALAEALASALRDHPAAERVEIAGSARRWTDTCRDLDLVATASDPAALAEAFCGLPLIGEVHSSAAAGAKAGTHNGMSIDLRIVPPENFGNLRQHYTGSKQHNEPLRAEAVRRGLHVSEHGVLDDSTETTHACATEEEVYELLGMPYIEPELRENRGELQAAREDRLPDLVRVDDP